MSQQEILDKMYLVEMKMQKIKNALEYPERLNDHPNIAKELRGIPKIKLLAMKIDIVEEEWIPLLFQIEKEEDYLGIKEKVKIDLENSKTHFWNPA